MDPITIIAIITAAINVASKGIALMADINSGLIKPDDIKPEDLKALDVDEIIRRVRAGEPV
jgi:hypothetical protein